MVGIDGSDPHRERAPVTLDAAEIAEISVARLQEQEAILRARQAVGQAGAGHDPPQAGIAILEGEAIGRVVRVQGDIGGPRLEDAEERDEQL